ncbi:MAG: undecaprenyl-diphosphatase UppP [Saprospiraceae bacterium]|nr:undecaprenyl-diphosphatase UppP [Saprospiraceae bacterium]
MNTIEAVILAIIEGITEFLPVSSTGHMIIASSVMGIAEDNFTKMFTVAIQFGAILSVFFIYWKRFFVSFEFYIKLLIAFIPAVIIGKLAGDYIDALLENVTIVAFSLLLGGIVLVKIDDWMKGHEKIGMNEPDYLTALRIGFFQCIAMIPGVSRSAASIIGGLFYGLNREKAAEFSFLLAMPTMFAATVYKMYDFYKKGGTFSSDEIQLLAIGNIVAFIVAILAIKLFINLLNKYGFKYFGYYRIILGATILALQLLGFKLSIL